MVTLSFRSPQLSHMHCTSHSVSWILSAPVSRRCFVLSRSVFGCNRDSIPWPCLEQTVCEIYRLQQEKPCQGLLTRTEQFDPAGAYTYRGQLSDTVCRKFRSRPRLQKLKMLCDTSLMTKVRSFKAFFTICKRTPFVEYMSVRLSVPSVT
jgi:hypothetical protein